MDFRVKCALQHAFSLLPYGRKLNYLMQRYVTKNLPVPDLLLDMHRWHAENHLRDFEIAVGRKPTNIFEFGSGAYLGTAVLFALSGAKVVASDISPNASRDLVQDLVRRAGADSVDRLGLVYLAPCDARSTGLASGSFDMVTSTSVLEHIPTRDLPAVIRECKRLLAPGGAASFCIDYSDHWAQFDRSISSVNFLRYGPVEWAIYNPGLHYQNRLRHSDYLKMFSDAGFELVGERTRRMSVPDIAVADEFRRYGKDDLEIIEAFVTLK